ncbi:hypothetical protein STANM309S_03461 [Streptomyces tanashiensis]
MAKVATTDHWVWHTSTVPANKDEEVELFVRERNGAPTPRRPREVGAADGVDERGARALAAELDGGPARWP